MDSRASGHSIGAVAILLVVLSACGGPRTATSSITTTTTVAATSTSQKPQASLQDVFGATLSLGYTLGDAEASVRNAIQQQAETAQGAKILRAADLKLIEYDGKTAGYVTVFLLQPSDSADDRAALVRGYADGQPGGTITTTEVNSRTVTMIRWSRTTRLAYAASSSDFVVIVVMQTKAQLDVVAPSLFAPV